MKAINQGYVCGFEGIKWGEMSETIELNRLNI